MISSSTTPLKNVDAYLQTEEDLLKDMISPVNLLTDTSFPETSEYDNSAFKMFALHKNAKQGKSHERKASLLKRNELLYEKLKDFQHYKGKKSNHEPSPRLDQTQTSVHTVIQAVNNDSILLIDARIQIQTIQKMLKKMMKSPNQSYFKHEVQALLDNEDKQGGSLTENASII